jgi:hypothetical protein
MPISESRNSLLRPRDGQPGLMNPVEITDEGKVENKPISNFQQAHSIYMRFERDNIARSLRNKVVDDKYNLMPPYRQSELDNTGQAWRANFSTGFIGSIKDRVTPKLTDTVHGMRYLTNARLPDNFPEADTKTDKFRRYISQCIRSWIGWTDLIDLIADEDSYFGYAAGVQTGELDWRPKTFRQDEMYFDEHAKQTAAELPVFAVRKSYYPFQMVDMISDRETAESIGYKVDNISAAIRACTAPVFRPNVDLRNLSDIVREGTLYYSYHRSVRMIETVHMFVARYDNNGIDHWWFNRKMENPPKRSKSMQPAGTLEDQDGDSDPNPIGFLYEQFDNMKMQDFITLFTFQVGNGRLFGSKGIGRQIANLDTAINRGRMNIIDSTYLASTVVGVMGENDLARLIPTVRFPFMWIPGVHKSSDNSSQSMWMSFCSWIISLSPWLKPSWALISLTKFNPRVFLPRLLKRISITSGRWKLSKGP